MELHDLEMFFVRKFHVVKNLFRYTRINFEFDICKYNIKNYNTNLIFIIEILENRMYFSI